MGIFKKKSDLAAGPDVPMEQVGAMKGQGYSNNQVIQSLQRDGYTSGQIFDAMSQSDMTPMTNPDPQMQTFTPQPYNPGAQQPQSFPPQPGFSPQQMPNFSPQQSFQQNNSQPPSFAPAYSDANPTTEEMIESIIDEKWNELVRDINKIIDWKQKVDLKLASVDQQVNDMKSQFDKLHQAIIGKIGEYDKHILDVGAELQAMEKVFSKVLPTFVDNVNELNRITEKIKNPSVKQKPKLKEDEE